MIDYSILPSHQLFFRNFVTCTPLHPDWCCCAYSDSIQMYYPAYFHSKTKCETCKLSNARAKGRGHGDCVAKRYCLRFFYAEAKKRIRERNSTQIFSGTPKTSWLLTSTLLVHPIYILTFDPSLTAVQMISGTTKTFCLITSALLFHECNSLIFVPWFVMVLKWWQIRVNALNSYSFSNLPNSVLYT